MSHQEFFSARKKHIFRDLGATNCKELERESMGDSVLTYRVGGKINACGGSEFAMLAKICSINNADVHNNVSRSIASIYKRINILHPSSPSSTISNRQYKEIR